MSGMRDYWTSECSRLQGFGFAFTVQRVNWVYSITRRARRLKYSSYCPRVEGGGGKQPWQATWGPIQKWNRREILQISSRLERNKEDVLKSLKRIAGWCVRLRRKMTVEIQDLIGVYPLCEHGVWSMWFSRAWTLDLFLLSGNFYPSLVKVWTRFHPASAQYFKVFLSL